MERPSDSQEAGCEGSPTTALPMISREERPPSHPEHLPLQPLLQDSVLIAEILSYVLTTTRDFARVRQVCKSWKNEILPYFLEHHSHHFPASEFVGDHQQFFFLRICHYNEDPLDALPAHQTNIPYRQARIPQVSRSPNFLQELVHLAYHHRFAGKRYDDLDVWKSIWDLPALDFWESVTKHLSPTPTMEGDNVSAVPFEVPHIMLQQEHSPQPDFKVGQSFENDISVQSLVIVREAVPSVYRIVPEQQQEAMSPTMTFQDHFASLCQALVETDSWPQFCLLGEEALNHGMFLSMGDYEAMVEAMHNQGSFAFESRIVPVIFTVRFRLPGNIISSDRQDVRSVPNQVCFQVRVPKSTLDDDDNITMDHVANGVDKNSTSTQMEMVPDDSRSLSPTMAPFVKYLPLQNGGDDDVPGQAYTYATFLGYNVQPLEMGDGIHLDEEDKKEEPLSTYYTCHVPMSFAWWELMELLAPEDGKIGSSENLDDDDCQHGLEDQGADSFLPVDWLRRTCEEQSVQEGVGIMDALLDFDRQRELSERLDALAEDVVSATSSISLLPDFSFRQWQERRHREQPTTHHMAGRTALVDPDLYCYSERHSVLNHSVLDVPPCTFSDSYLDPPILQTVNYWGRSYNGSLEYQWLPTYFDVDPDGKTTIIRDYINNLVPRQRYEDLYGSLSQLFSIALPLLESVFSYCRVIKRNHVRMVESNQQTWHPLPPTPLKEEPTLLRGQSLQVITEIEEYNWNEASSCSEEAMMKEEGWHVKGMPHEEIVATAMYVLPMKEKQQLGRSSVGTIEFQRAFFNNEANYLFSAIDRDRPPEIEAEVYNGLLPLGQADLIPGRLLVFPNYHVSKRCLRMHPSSKSADCKLRLIMFHLVNPEKRVISTREVETQQQGAISPEQAQAHKVELQTERDAATPDWNVREIHLL